MNPVHHKGEPAIALAELADGAMVAVDVAGREILLARVGDEVFALDNVCSHAEGWLDMGTLHPSTCEVECPMHEGRFDLRTGQPTHEPCELPVTRYAVQVVDGVVRVEVP